MRADTATPQGLQPGDVATGVGAVLKILDLWGCSESEKKALLGVSRATLHNYKKGEGLARPSRDLVDRVSYILNIYAALKQLFNNPENVNGFVRRKNYNPFFNGRSPMEVMGSGHLAALYETFRRIDALRGGGW